jgi:hypothetical protein
MTKNSKQKTYEDCLIGLIRSSGPCTIVEIVLELIEKTSGEWSNKDCNYHKRWCCAKEEAVAAINRMTRSGKIVLYDTGDAWELA